MLNERLPEGWWVQVSESLDQTCLTIGGPNGQGAAFLVKRGSVRAQVLQNFRIAMTARNGGGHE